MIRQLFNDGWTLVTGGGGFIAELMGIKAEEKQVALPHDAMIHETPDPDTINGSQSGFYPGGEYIYTKTFFVPEDWEGKDILLEFEGVYMTAMVYVNGSHAATNLYGYSGFYVTLNDLLSYGADNEIRVVANNPAPNSRWYSGSGIYRNVNLLVGGDVHIETDGVRAVTRLACREEAILEVETRLVNLTRKHQKITLRTTLLDEDIAVKTDTVIATLFSEDHETLRQSMHLENPKLWNVDSPNLYDLKVEILQQDQVLDTVCERIGLRTLTLDTVYGLRINGVPVKQKGTCIHHDNGIIGAATFAAAEDRKARLIKEAGFNAVRSAHHPMSRAMLSACDRYGLLVMDELSDIWFEHKNTNDFALYFDRCWEQEAERMTAKDYNHPCVILYSTGNEIPDLGHAIGGRMNRKICNRFHELDATRFTTAGVNGMMVAAGSGIMDQIIDDLMKKRGIDPLAALAADGTADGDAATDVGGMNMAMSLVNTDDFTTHPKLSEMLEEPAQAADIAGYNYLTGRHGEMEHLLHPNKPVLGTETYPPDIVRLWRIVETYPHVLGDYTWAGYDYLGEAGCGIFYYDGKRNFGSYFPDRLANIGDIDIIGSRRPISYLREIVFGDRKEPYIAVIRPNRYGQAVSGTSWMYKDNVSCWTWPGLEGTKTEAEVYSPDDAVELFLNGVSLGRKPAGREHGFTAVYEITYEPGVLEAVSYKDGTESGRFCLRTADPQTILNVEADRTEIAAGGQDLAFITVSLTDGSGNLKMYESRSVSVSVEGDGSLQGFGSADPSPVISYQDTVWPVYDGRVMAVIRSGKISGEIHVTFASEGLEPVCVTIRTI